jgi:hypothetical protein
MSVIFSSIDLIGVSLSAELTLGNDCIALLVFNRVYKCTLSGNYCIANSLSISLLVSTSVVNCTICAIYTSTLTNLTILIAKNDTAVTDERITILIDVRRSCLSLVIYDVEVNTTDRTNVTLVCVSSK